MKFSSTIVLTDSFNAIKVYSREEIDARVSRDLILKSRYEDKDIKKKIA